jgi:Holliday junction resolvase RusA-like endonuclease
MHEFQLPGAPISAARPRVTRRGFAFDPKAKEKKLARTKIAELWKQEILKEPLSLELSFLMPIPKSTSKKRRQELLGSPHVIKPDCDNLAKFTLDVLTGIVYGDDSCVFDLRINKTYSNEPKTLIKIHTHRNIA